MSDLIRHLTAPAARVSIAADGWATISTGQDDLHVPVAQLVEPLVSARDGDLISSEPLRHMSDAVVEALRAVAERRIVRDTASGRWRHRQHDADKTIGLFIDAFVTGGMGDAPSDDETVTLRVSVSEDGRAHIEPVARSSDRSTHDVLRSAADIWAPVGRLASGAPRTRLTDSEVAELIDPVMRSRLHNARIHSEWASDVANTTIALSLDEDASTLAWQLRIPQGGLTPAEVAELTEAQRPLVRLRDTWVVNDARHLARLHRPERRHLTPGERAAALITGTYRSGEDSVPLASSTATRARLDALSAAPPAVSSPQALDATLRRYQLDGLAWMLRNADLGLGSCLADDMGLGKTVSAIAFHLALRERELVGPTLIVCPASVLSTWERETARFAPTQSTVRYHGVFRTIASSTDLVVTTYATLRNDHDILKKTQWGLVIADEAQMMKNDSSQTARALRSLTATHRLALSGTPIQNSLDDLWSLLDWTAPGLLGSKREFRHHYAGPIEKGAETAHLRLTKLSSLAVLRRRKDDPRIAPELPAKTITNQIVALTREQVGLYQAVVDESLAQIAELDDHARRGVSLPSLPRSNKSAIIRPTTVKRTSHDYRGGQANSTRSPRSSTSLLRRTHQR